jgi:hypothetical protein
MVKLFVSEGYTTKVVCENGIESVRKNSQDDSRYDKLEAKSGQPYFNLKAGKRTNYWQQRNV